MENGFNPFLTEKLYLDIQMKRLVPKRYKSIFVYSRKMQSKFEIDWEITIGKPIRSIPWKKAENEAFHHVGRGRRWGRRLGMGCRK
jgi:hypothetical protein